MKRKILWVFAIALVLALAMGISAQASDNGLEDIFELRGYSVSPDGTSITAGFVIDYGAKATYEAQLGREIEMGVVFASYDQLGGRLPLDENGNPITFLESYVIKFSLNDYDYLTYNFNITDLTEELHAHKFVVSAYVYNGENVYYYDEDGVSDNVTGV